MTDNGTYTNKMKKDMPIQIYMLMAYFSGAFATLDKTNWYIWLLPLFPLIILIPLKLIWGYKPEQRHISDYNE